MSIKTILIADDNKCLQWSLSTWLKYCGEDFSVMTADTGRETLNLLADFRPDLVVMSLRMPDLDASEYLRPVAASRAETAIIAMIPYIDEEISEQLQFLGASDYVLKPFKFEVLLDKMYSCCFRRAQENTLIGSNL